MKLNHRMHQTGSRRFIRLFRDEAVGAKVQRREPFVLRSTSSARDIGSPDATGFTLNRLLNRLLTVLAFIAIITIVIVFLGICWLIRAGQLLPRSIKSLFSGAAS